MCSGDFNMSNFLFWTWPILLFFGVAAIKGIFGKPRIKPGYAGFAEQHNKEASDEFIPISTNLKSALNPDRCFFRDDE